MKIMYRPGRMNIGVVTPAGCWGLNALWGLMASFFLLLAPSVLADTSQSGPAVADDCKVVDDRLAVFPLVIPSHDMADEVDAFNKAMREAATRLIWGPDLRILDEQMAKELYRTVMEDPCSADKCLFERGCSMETEYLLSGVVKPLDAGKRYAIELQLLSIRRRDLLLTLPLEEPSLAQMKGRFKEGLEEFAQRGSERIGELERRQDVQARKEGTRLTKKRLSGVTLGVGVGTLGTFVAVPWVMKWRYEGLDVEPPSTFDEAWASATTWENWQKPGFVVGGVLTAIGGVGLGMTW